MKVEEREASRLAIQKRRKRESDSNIKIFSACKNTIQTRRKELAKAQFERKENETLMGYDLPRNNRYIERLRFAIRKRRYFKRLQVDYKEGEASRALSIQYNFQRKRGLTSIEHIEREISTKNRPRPNTIRT
jgi:hypothetical protein